MLSGCNPGGKALAAICKQLSYRVAASVGSAEEAVQLIEQEIVPEIILMDLGLPGMSGIEAIRIIKKHRPTVKIMVLTIYEDEQHFFEALKTDTQSSLRIDAKSPKIKASSAELFASGSSMSPRIERRATSTFHCHRQSHELSPLTPRETEVLCALAEGHSYNALAQQFFISLHTVQNHIKNIYAKLGAHSRTEAVNTALRRNLIPPPSLTAR